MLTLPILCQLLFASTGLALSIPEVQQSLQEPIDETKHKHIAIPPIGLGLWNSKAENATNAVEWASKAGYHHFDSAAAYSNEEYVGQAIHKITTKKHPRKSYWITSKLWNTAHRPQNVAKALDKTLSSLQTPYLDLYLMHWPVAFKPDEPRTVLDPDVSVLDTWRAMEDLVRANKTRYIGVSNFSPRQLNEIIEKCEICPYAHEFELHPYLQQQDFVNWHHKHNIKVIAYSPLANLNPTYAEKYPDIKPILEDKFWTGMAKDKNCTVAQAVLAWGMQRGTIVIPKSTHKDRIEENLKALKVVGKFSKEEMETIQEQDKRARFNNPSKSWGVDLFEDLDDGSSSPGTRAPPGSETGALSNIEDGV